MLVLLFLLVLIGIPMIIISLPVVKYLRDNVITAVPRKGRGPGV